jgi:dipeptidyl-peptidase-4
MTGSLTQADYRRAERFLPWNADKLVFNFMGQPQWFTDDAGRSRCWYRVRTRQGDQFMLVDPEAGTRRRAFDHPRLAAALTVALGRPIEHVNLPFDAIDVVAAGTAIEFVVDGRRWRCDLASYACTEVGTAEPDGENGESAAPDGRWVAFARDGNLFLRDAASGDERQLTDDGEPGNAYATPNPSPLPAAGIAARPLPSEPVALWSPDSRRFITYRLDRRDAGLFHLLQAIPPDGSTRLAVHTSAYPLPGDEIVPTAQLLVVDVERGEVRPVDDEPVSILYYGSPLRPGWLWWSDDGQRLYHISQGRGYQSYRLTVVDAATGAARTLVEEQDEVAIDPRIVHGGQPAIRVFAGGRSILWFSQRDGWGHLYHYDAETGALQRQLTAGAWAVVDPLFIDEAGRLIYFTAVGREAGRDPYFPHLYRVSLDGGEPELLTPEDAAHEIAFAPDGRAFVDTFSRVDQPPVSLLRSADGALVCELERADVDPLLATGWRPPERFTVKARDGVTDLYGVLYRPSRFDPAKDGTLPILDDIYAGPQTNRAPTTFCGSSSESQVNNNFWQAQAIAELGFAVVMIDGIGMPFRSKAFHDRSFRQLGDGGIEDHVAGIRQLAERYPYLDVERVGIYGHSAGGYASAHAILAFPDFYRVCVSSAGNHDHRLDKASWVERYMGLPVGDHYTSQANATLAGNLTGKLLLAHGEMDENVHVASTLQLVDALIQQNKDFDLLILPNRPHAFGTDPYFIRRKWEYFARHLLGRAPLPGYRVRGPDAANR